MESEWVSEECAKLICMESSYRQFLFFFNFLLPSLARSMADLRHSKPKKNKKNNKEQQQKIYFLKILKKCTNNSTLYLLSSLSHSPRRLRLPVLTWFPRSSCFANEFAISLISGRWAFILLPPFSFHSFKFNECAAASTKINVFILNFNWY